MGVVLFVLKSKLLFFDVFLKRSASDVVQLGDFDGNPLIFLSTVSIMYAQSVDNPVDTFVRGCIYSILT